MKITLCVLSCVFLASCANLQGIPSGLTDQNSTDLEKNTLSDSLKVASDLKKTYETARDNNLKYAFWSNVTFVPLAAGAAGAIAFNAYKDLLAGIGIAAGSLAGLNMFVNARANAKVYQSGMNALLCVRTSLGPYLTVSSEPLTAGVPALADRITQASRTLTDATSLKFDTPQQIAEIRNNPLVVTTLASSEKTLTQAIADAKKTLGDAQAELGLYAGIASFAAGSIRQIDSVVASKITQPDISFSALEASILGLTKAPTPASTTPPKPAPAPIPGVLLRPAPPSSTPIADAAAEAQKSARALADEAAALTGELQKFGLSAQEKTVADCIKNF